MSDIKRVGDLEVGQDLNFQRRSWTLERAGWVVMILLLIAALLGLLGPGPLSSATAGDPDSALWVEYNRFERYHAPTTLRAHIGLGAARGGKVRLWLSRGFVESTEIHHIYPDPEVVEAGTDRFTYVFAAPDESKPVVITYQFESQKYWGQAARIGLDAGPELEFSQFIYP